MTIKNKIKEDHTVINTDIEIKVTAEDLMKDLVEEIEGNIIIPSEQKKEDLN